MKIYFLGVGEAVDEKYPNNSHILSHNESNILFDCGYSIPHVLWNYNSDVNFLDAIYISHPHADHYFGLPLLFVRMWEGQRTKPLTIITEKGNKKLIEELADYAYKGFYSDFSYEINFLEVEDGAEIEYSGLQMNFAPTAHTINNLAVSVSDGNKKYCYSGDGENTEKAEEIYKGSDLLIHESYLPHEKKWGHACACDVIPMTDRIGVKNLALTHLHRDFRRTQLAEIEKYTGESKSNIFVPEPGESFEL